MAIEFKWYDKGKVVCVCFDADAEAADFLALDTGLRLYLDVAAQPVSLLFDYSHLPGDLDPSAFYLLRSLNHPQCGWVMEFKGRYIGDLGLVEDGYLSLRSQDDPLGLIMHSQQVQRQADLRHYLEPLPDDAALEATRPMDPASFYEDDFYGAERAYYG